MQQLGISAAQAIAQQEGQTRLSTSSQRLNNAFFGLQSIGVGRESGIARGTVGEIVGPPGIGKTTLALQVAANVVKKGESVIWIDTSSVFPIPRLRGILGSSEPRDCVTRLLSQIHSLSIRSLPSLLALLLHTAHTDTSIFAETPDLALLVIDDLSTPILEAYPYGFEDEFAKTKSVRKEFGSTGTSTRRTNVLKGLANKLASLAINRNISILVLSQLTTKIVSGNSAVLVPSLGDAWTSVCSFRVTLYRQQVPPDFCNRPQDVRYAHFQKREGIVVKDEGAQNVPFLITDAGIEDVVFPEDSNDRKHRLEDDGLSRSPLKKQRIVSFTDDVIDDSEGEEADFFFTEIEDIGSGRMANIPAEE